MNICLIDPDFLKKNHAGTTTYNFYLAKGLTSCGHETHIICEDGPDKQKIKSPKLIFHYASTKDKSNAQKTNKNSTDLFGIKTFLYLTFSLLRKSWIYFRIYKQLSRARHIDIIECSDDLFAFWFVIFCSKKLIIRIHGPWTLIWKLNNKKFGLAGKVVFFLEKFQFKKAKHLTTPSNFMVNFINNYYKTSKKIAVLKNPIDVSFIERAVKRSQPYFLFLGRIEINKGIEEILKIAESAYAKNFQILIAGKKDDRFDQVLLNKIIRKRNITYLGSVAYDILLDKIAGAEVILAPSNFENCSYAILESLALGKIVVASNINGNRAIIKSKDNGFLCDADYQKCIKRALDLKANQKALLRRRAKKTAREHDIKKVIPAFLKFYKRIIHAEESK